MIGHVAHTLLQLFYGINDGRNVIKFTDNFLPAIQPLGAKIEALREEMMSTDRLSERWKRRMSENGVNRRVV
jgi:hypothetical protein